MDLHRIRKMARVAKYVDKDTAGRLRIARFYRSDFIGMQLLRNAVLVTIGFAILAGIYLAVRGEDLMTGIYQADLGLMAYLLLILYLAVLLLYTIITYFYSSHCYKKAKKMERYLDHQLELLQAAYGEDHDEGDNE